MSDLVDLLIAPQRPTLGRPKISLKEGIALVLGGHFADYDGRAEASGLPRISQPAVPEGTSEARLLNALLATFQGMPGGVRELMALASGDQHPSDVVTVAAVVGSIGLATSGRFEDSAMFLQARLPLASEPMHEAILALHAGYRLAEIARYDEALRRTARVSELVAEHPSSERWRTLRAIAEANALTYQGAIGQFAGDRRRLISTAALSTIDTALAAGLRSYLRQHFDTQFATPYTRTISFSATDPVDAPLSRALIRAEMLAYRFAVDEAHELIGKYRLLSAVGREDAQPRAALVMLVRARDHKAIHLGVGLYRAVGPLAPLKEAGDFLCSAEWPAPQLKAHLVAIRDCGPLLSPAVAETAANRILESLPVWTGWVVGVGRVESEAMGALASLEPILTEDWHARAAVQFLELAHAPPDPMLHQHMGPPLRALEWKHVAQPVRRSWLSFVEASLNEKTDHRFVAHAAAIAMANEERSEVGRILRQAFDREPSLYIAAAMIESGVEMGIDAQRRALDLALAEVRHARDQASQGSYSIGGLVQAGAFLAHLAAKLQHPGATSAAVDLLYDTRAPLEDRAAVANTLSRERVPIAVDSLPPPGQTDLPFDEPAAFQAAVLRFGAAYGVLRKGEAIDRLMTLANSRDTASRIHTAHCLPDLRGLIPGELGAAVALTLAADDDVHVLTAAAQVLPRMAVPGLRQAIRHRTLAFLDAPGDQLPAAALAGWDSARAEGMRIPPEVMSRAERMRKHLSYRIRHAATAFLESLPRA